MPTVRNLREKGNPILRQLPQNRWALTRAFVTGNVDTFPMADVPPYDELDQGTLTGQGLTNLRLRTREWDSKSDGILFCTYETLTDTFVLAKDPVTDYDLNGLRRDTLTYIARVTANADAFIAANANYDGRPLAKKTVVEEPGAKLVELVYLEPGVISKAESPGPVPGSVQHSWVTWILDATSEVDMGVGGTIPGELIEKEDDNFQGYKVRRWVTVGGAITGTKQTYKDVVDVEVPGTVELTTIPVEVDELSGTIAIAKVTPPRAKSVAATVTVEITTSPPNTASVAYDLGAISCSVTATQASYDYRGFDRMSTISGSVTVTAERRSANIGANIQTYPRCYLINTSATGSFSYVAGSQLERSSGGTIVSGTPMSSYETNTLTGTGSTAATGYSTSGVLRRKSRPVFTTLAGTTYYEVITWSV